MLPESLLPSCVPDLQFDCLPADIDHSRTELHADGVVRVLFNCHREVRVKNKKCKPTTQQNY